MDERRLLLAFEFLEELCEMKLVLCVLCFGPLANTSLSLVSAWRSHIHQPNDVRPTHFRYEDAVLIGAVADMRRFG
jgi:hypothetical protein